MSPLFLARRARGFTLIELLLVVGIIATLASIVILAVNPQRQLSQARDTQRKTSVTTILNALYQYAIDNNGNLPDALSGSTFTLGTARPLCRSTVRRGGIDPGGGTCPADTAGPTYNAVSLWALSGSYLKTAPVDPSVASNSGWTKFYITKFSNGRIMVSAAAETPGAASISVTR